MRVRKVKNGMTVNAVAGTYVVFFGLDLVKQKRPQFRGFAFKRLDHSDGETVWLRGMKTFEAIQPHTAPGEVFSTRDHPIQGFQWADYSTHPGRDYTYTILALYGKPGKLVARIELAIPISTEPEMGPTHSAFFNRGSVATQEYARRFQNKSPNKFLQPAQREAAYEWLSRGLLDALVKFLGRARQGWEVHGAVYEFQWPEALAAVKQASERGADVRMLFDDVETYDKDGTPKGPWKANRDAIAKAKIKSLCKGRKNGKLMHNKFFVLSKDGKPQAVWTGSTNLTENGIFGHSNVGHIVEDKKAAKSYLEYWERLNKDPGINKDYRNANMAASPAPPENWTEETTTVFSPRGTQLDALEWYAQVAGSAMGALFMTFAFGMHEKFKQVYREDDPVLRMALLEKAESSPATKERDEEDIQEIRNRPNVIVAIGNRIVTNSFDRWLKEMAQISAHVHVHWIHTKYMLLDPLSARPVLVTGSANFSKASTDTNDENMLVIRGNKRITDIYLGEYLRLYNHYAFRESVKWHMEKEEGNKPDNWRPQFLIDDDKWMKPYFDPKDTGARNSRREYFSGPMAI